MKTKEQILKELKELEAAEAKKKEALIAEIMELQEMEDLFDFCTFDNSYTIPVTIKAECSFVVPPFEKQADGEIYAEAEEPKKHNFSPFLIEDGLSNLGMENINDIKSICPDIAEQLRGKIELEEKLLKIVSKLAKKAGFDKSTQELQELIGDAFNKMSKE
jgi:hypothetical protein